MRYVAAYLLAALSGGAAPTAADIEKILSSVGIESDPVKLKLVISQLGGKNIEELVNSGSKKLATMPAGGGGGAAAPAAAAGGAAPAAKAAEKKVEKKVESEEEEDDDMGFGLFD